MLNVELLVQKIQIKWLFKLLVDLLIRENVDGSLQQSVRYNFRPLHLLVGESCNLICSGVGHTMVTNAAKGSSQPTTRLAYICQCCVK